MAANARASFIGDYMRGKTAGLSRDQRAALFREASHAYHRERHGEGDPPGESDGTDGGGLLTAGLVVLAAVGLWKWLGNKQAFPAQTMPGPTQGTLGGY